MTRKRSRGEYDEDQRIGPDGFGVGQTLSMLSGTLTDHTSGLRKHADEGWQTVSHKSKAKQRKRAKNAAEANEDDGRPKYPSITHSPQARLQSPTTIGDLQSLILYLLADGPSPNWVAIRHQSQLKKVVVLLVPGLEPGMFNGSLPLSGASSNGHKANASLTSKVNDSYRSPDEYYPQLLKEDKLPVALKPLGRFFPHIWPIQTPGDHRISRIWSPLMSILSVPLPKSKEEKQQKGPRPPREGNSWQNKATPITEYVATREQLLDNDYVLHDTVCNAGEDVKLEHDKRSKLGQTQQDGWMDSASVSSSIVNEPSDVRPATAPQHTVPSDPSLAGQHVLAIDCEMCQTGEGRFELTRLSVLDWSDTVVLDTLVKPLNPITNYLTQYSGITAEKLDPITTTLQDAQKMLLAIIRPTTILMGHSLNSDLAALKLVHPRIIDTSMLYPHPGGSHLKSSLKWLAKKYLNREIQKGANGHDSTEDARTAMDLVKQKCQKGPKWGTSDASVESIFKRIGRHHRSGGVAGGILRQGGVVDWGVPRRGHGAAADVCIGCDSDQDVVDGIKRAVHGDEDGKEISGGGVDLVWARLRELEAYRGWWESSKTADNDALRETAKALSTNLEDAVARTVDHVQRIYDNLPACTALIVYSGTGDPTELRKWQAIHQTYKDEFKVKKWDELSVKWTDDEEKELKKAFKVARNGCGFITVK